ncbi:DNA double-strand break repair Rad50 ATPase [Bienertia sinuspersici]
MTILAREESNRFLRMPTKSLRCMSYEDTLREMEAFLDGKLDNPQNTNDVYVDITEPMSSSVVRMPDSEDPDATENSSSFGDTLSRDEDVSGTSDTEVESEFRVDSGSAPILDGYGSTFYMRKKKVTDHWRSFIRPLMWRCKWTEIKIKELESQALKYSRELEANEQTKMLELHQYTSDFCSKSFPFFNQSGRKKPLKRKKRKPVENVTDVSSYMSHHQLFSYFESKKSDQDALPAADDDVEFDLTTTNEDFGMDDDWFKDDDDPMEQIFRQIETVQTQVHRLRTHLDMVMLKNGVKFSSSENLSLLAPYDALTSAAQSPAFSPGNGDNLSLGAVHIPQHMDFEIGDLVLPDGIIPGYKDDAQIPDIIESTVGLLSAADVTIHQPQLLESGENILDDTHIPNRGMRKRQMSCGALDQLNGEYHNLKNEEQNISRHKAMKERQMSCGALDQLNGEHHNLDDKGQNISTRRAVRERQMSCGALDQLKGEYQKLENKEQIISTLRASNGLVPHPVPGDPVIKEKSILKSCLNSDVRIPKNKRTRGERKAGPGGWSMRSTGEPDSN